jgi:hypothetical protein
MVLYLDYRVCYITYRVGARKLLLSKCKYCTERVLQMVDKFSNFPHADIEHSDG